MLALSMDSRMMSHDEFIEAGAALSREANVSDGLHRYFTTHCDRIYECCRRFKLLESNLGDVLEIGPFYSYTPFVLRPQSSSYVVLEGDDPAAYSLTPLYAQRKMRGGVFGAVF